MGRESHGRVPDRERHAADTKEMDDDGAASGRASVVQNRSVENVRMAGPRAHGRRVEARHGQVTADELRNLDEDRWQWSGSRR